MIRPPLISALLAFAFSAAACGGATPRPSCDIPEDGNLFVEGTDRVNPDARGRSLPTVVRVFQLTSIGLLEEATFEELWHTPEDTLGDTMLEMAEMTYYPGEHGRTGATIRRSFERSPDTNFIVGMAIVRRPAGVSWRTVIELPVPATELACAAQQVDPESPPPLPEISQIRFELDDYRIEGFLTVSEQPACDRGDLDCLESAVRDARDSAEGAEGQASDLAEQAPEVPQ